MKRRPMELKLISTLKHYTPEGGTHLIHPEDTVQDVIDFLDIPRGMVRMCMADGRVVPPSAKLGKTQVLMLVPAMGGG